MKYALWLSLFVLSTLFFNIQVVGNGTCTWSMEKDSIIVQGVVVDRDNTPLENVSVVVNKTAIKIFTNEKGEFTVFVRPGAKLVFSCVGKLQYSCKVKHKGKIVVKMADDPKMYAIRVNNTLLANTIEENVFFTVEEMPRFLEGDVNKYIAKNIKYPEKAKDKKIEGTVIVQFIIEKDGKISNIKILRPVHPLLDTEATRVIEGMPDWVPGKQKGEPERVIQTVSVVFKL